MIFELNNNHPFSKVEWPTGKISVTSSRFTSLNDTQSWYAVWLLCFTHCWKTRQNQEDTNTVCKNPQKSLILKNNTVYNIPRKGLACSVHTNLGNRHFPTELKLKGSNLNPNLSNLHFMPQKNYNWRTAIVTADELNKSLWGLKTSDTSVSIL